MNLREKNKITRDQADELRIWQIKVYDDVLKKSGGSRSVAFRLIRNNASMILACYVSGDEPEDVWAQLGN